MCIASASPLGSTNLKESLTIGFSRPLSAVQVRYPFGARLSSALGPGCEGGDATYCIKCYQGQGKGKGRSRSLELNNERRFENASAM